MDGAAGQTHAGNGLPERQPRQLLSQLICRCLRCDVDTHHGKQPEKLQIRQELVRGEESTTTYSHASGMVIKPHRLESGVFVTPGTSSLSAIWELSRRVAPDGNLQRRRFWLADGDNAANVPRSMSQHSSLKGQGAIKAKRNVLKRFERVEVLKKRGQFKDGQRVIGLPKTKPDE